MTFEEIKARMGGKRVGIAGCGGLGSNCAVALARIGTGTLVIADFDVVTSQNLNRQYFFLDQVGMKKVNAIRDTISRINPGVKVIGHDLKLTPANIPAVFEGCDVVVEAFDLAAEKEMLIETVLAAMPSTPLVIGLGMAGWGMNDSIHCRRSGNLFICGDEISEISPDLPPVAPRVGMVANMQANVVAEILLTGEQVNR
jgi:sulfur carrier protein ThiS adenylyltransferase